MQRDKANLSLTPGKEDSTAVFRAYCVGLGGRETIDTKDPDAVIRDGRWWVLAVTVLPRVSVKAARKTRHV